MQTFLRKLSSRKLWVAIVGVVVGIAAAFGIEGNEYTEIAGIVTAAASVVSYIFGESRVDAAGAVPLILPPESDTETDDKSEDAEE
jgi:hypothetical protein